jgi:hypothetical protein
MLSSVAARLAAGSFFMCILITGCGRGPLEPPVDEEFDNPVFAGAKLIEIGSPGPLCSVSTQPTFSWKATGQQLDFVGIFVANIAVRAGQIVNVEANVWAWNSGLGTGREGNVFYTQGVPVRGGVLDPPATVPPPLPPGNYVWAVWAWDSLGMKVTHSSEEIFFTADTLPRGCPSPAP